jgi:hypothetical protein
MAANVFSHRSLPPGVSWITSAVAAAPAVAEGVQSFAEGLDAPSTTVRTAGTLSADRAGLADSMDLLRGPDPHVERWGHQPTFISAKPNR